VAESGRAWPSSSEIIFLFLFQNNPTFISDINIELLRDHPFKTSACLKGGRGVPKADGQKVTVDKDQKSPS
jgi:hypothetical protein